MRFRLRLVIAAVVLLFLLVRLGDTVFTLFKLVFREQQGGA